MNFVRLVINLLRPYPVSPNSVFSKLASVAAELKSARKRRQPKVSPMYLSLSRITCAKFISVYNFSTQQLPSFEIQHILNFRVVTVRDIKLRSRLSKNIIYFVSFRHFRSSSIRKVLM